MFCGGMGGCFGGSEREGKGIGDVEGTEGGHDGAVREERRETKGGCAGKGNTWGGLGWNRRRRVDRLEG